MIEITTKLDKDAFVKSLFAELSKLPFGSLPKVELELVIFHSIILANGGYEKLNEMSPFLQRNLKLSKTKFKNKVLEAQLRFDNISIDPIQFLKEMIFEKQFSELIFDDKYLIIYISNPLNLDIIKTFFDSNEILNDTSFNKNILKVQTKGLIRIITKVLSDDQLKKIEDELKKHKELANNPFSLIGNVNINSLFSAEISFDPLKSVSKLISFVKETLSL